MIRLSLNELRKAIHEELRQNMSGRIEFPEYKDILGDICFIPKHAQKNVQRVLGALDSDVTFDEPNPSSGWISGTLSRTFTPQDLQSSLVQNGFTYEVNGLKVEPKYTGQRPYPRDMPWFNVVSDGSTTVHLLTSHRLS